MTSLCWAGSISGKPECEIEKNRPLGTVTPNGLFFSISHSGLPDIDPAQHKLVIHGLVKQPLVYTVESLSRYPMVTRMHFLECSGNSAPMFSNEPVQATAQALHGLCSNAEW